MKKTSLFLVNFLFVCCQACPAEEVSDEDFWKFFNADPKEKQVVNPQIQTSADATGIMDKWKEFQSVERVKLEKNLLGMRQVTAEILVKKALTARPDERGDMLSASTFLKSADPALPLLEAPGTNFKRLIGLVGKWELTWGGSGTHEFAMNGRDTVDAGKSMTWEWVDYEAGVLITRGGRFGNLSKMETGFMRGINSDQVGFIMKKLPGDGAVSKDPSFLKLNTDEALQRATLEGTLTKKRQRVITWLLEKAKQLPVTEMSKILTDVHALEQTRLSEFDGVEKLAGEWRFGRETLQFQPLGIVVQNARPVGHWAWVEDSKRSFAFVIKGGKTNESVCMAAAPTDAAQTSMPAQQIDAVKFTVTRKLPQ